jgi:hypothetical protein
VSNDEWPGLADAVFTAVMRCDCGSERLLVATPGGALCLRCLYVESFMSGMADGAQVEREFRAA